MRALPSLAILAGCLTLAPLPVSAGGGGPVVLYDFQASAQGWLSGGAIGVFDLPQASWTQQALVLRPLNNTNTFGFWDSPTTNLIQPKEAIQGDPFSTKGGAGVFNRFDFKVMSESETMSSLVPTFRLRSAFFDNQIASVTVVESTPPVTVGPPTPFKGSISDFGRSYEHFAPLLGAGGEWRFSFDVLNFNGIDENSALRLQDVSQQPVSIMPLNTVTYDFSNGNENGFVPQSAPPLLPATGVATSDGIRLTGVTIGEEVPAEGIIFGSYTRPNVYALEGGKRYVVGVRVSSTADSADAASVPTFRLRVNETSLQMAWYTNLESVSSLSLTPTTSNSPFIYLCFHVPPELDGTQAILSFDYLWAAGTGNDPSIGIVIEEVNIAEASPLI